MKYRKTRLRSIAGSKGSTEDIRDRLDSIDEDTDLKLQTLGCVFSGTKDCPEEFHQLYVQPLLDAGLTLENSLEMLIDGVLLPN
jgi:hypothetical protein